MLNVVKKTCAILLSGAIMLVGTGITASAASWRTGNFPSSGNTSAITVNLSNKSKDAYIKVHTYGYSDYKGSSGKNVYVTMRNTNGGWIWGGSITAGSSGKKMRLGHDNAKYKIYLKHDTASCRKNNPGLYRNYSNDSLYFRHECPTSWGIECVSNCSVS